MNLHIFDRFPDLVTPRLSLRQIEGADAPALLALRADPENGRFQHHDPFTGLAAAAAQISRWRKRFVLRAEIRWAITTTSDGAFIGTCAFTHFVPQHDRGHVAYEIARAAWGRGFAAEALSAVTAFGLGEAGLARIEAVVRPGNEASARVLQKAGFAEEGLLRAYALFRGEHHDMRMFAAARRAHEEPRSAAGDGA